MKYLIIVTACFLAAAQAKADRISQDFIAADTDRDGYISYEELAVMQNSSISRQNTDIITLLDGDGDGAVSKEEYIDFYSKIAAAQPKGAPDLDKNFKILDANQDNMLTAEELSNFRSENLESNNKTAMEALDTDKDGRISREEYDNFVKTMEQMLQGLQF